MMGKMAAAVMSAAAVLATGAGTAWAGPGGNTPQATSPAYVSGMPAMGYNTWYQFRTGANEADVLAEAKELADSGLAAAGYNTVNLDDGWMLKARDAAGNLVPDPAKFPHGMTWLAGQLHNLGLRFGVYTAIGTWTCQRYPGSYGHYKQDAALFSSWQVDYVKVDSCGGTNPQDETSLAADFASFGGDLRADSPGMLYSQELPVLEIGTPYFIPAVTSSSQWANSWRMAPDEYGTAVPVIGAHLRADIHLHGYARPDHWNDLDLLIPPSIMPGPSSAAYLTDEQAQLGGWAMEASPLLVSANLLALSPAELVALKNPDIKAIDQSGAQAAREADRGPVMGFAKPAEGGTAIYLYNDGSSAYRASYSLASLGISAAHVAYRNVWTGHEGTAGGITVTLVPGASLLLEVHPL